MSELLAATTEMSTPLELTPREVEILRRLSSGRLYRDVAPELFISVGTLRNHVHKILAKTGARKLLEAIDIARREGLFDGVKAQERR